VWVVLRGEAVADAFGADVDGGIVWVWKPTQDSNRVLE